MAKNNQWMVGLNKGDVVFAIGQIQRNTIDRDIGLLVRRKNGSYYWLYKNKPDIIEIRGVLQRLKIEHVVGEYVHLISLVTDSGLIYFLPSDLYPDPAKLTMRRFFPVNPEYVLNQIKTNREMAVMDQCPICGAIRLASEPKCSNPDCVSKLASIEESSKATDEAQLSCIIGGGAGVIIGFLLLGIAIVAERVFNAPLISPTLREQYWWAFPVGIGLLGYLGLYIYLMNYSSKESELEKSVKKA